SRFKTLGISRMTKQHAWRLIRNVSPQSLAPVVSEGKDVFSGNEITEVQEPLEQPDEDGQDFLRHQRVSRRCDEIITRPAPHHLLREPRRTNLRFARLPAGRDQDETLARFKGAFLASVQVPTEPVFTVTSYRLDQGAYARRVREVRLPVRMAARRGRI